MDNSEVETVEDDVPASELLFGEDDVEWGEYSVEESGELEENESMLETRLTESSGDLEDSVESNRTRSQRASSFKPYISQWKDERAREAAALEEEKKERLRKLMRMVGAKDLDTESVETVLSYLEEEEKKIDEDESSREASTYMCFKTIDISDSQLRLLNIYNEFPIPEDPGLAPAFYVLYPPPKVYKDDGIQKFVDTVQSIGVRPINSVKEMLETDTLNLRYYGIDPKIVYAICEAVRNNTSVQTIDLTGNWLTDEACYHINDLLTSNLILSRLVLSGCRIGAQGAKELRDGIAAAPALIEIDLTYCDIGDEGLQYITTAVCKSKILENINLSHNKLGADSGEILSDMLMDTETLKHLDLSWNDLFHEEFAESFFVGLTVNLSLRYLNMSWNALAESTTPSLCSFLADSKNLQEYDLTGNRFTAVEGAKIAKALSKNDVLEILRLGDNPLEPAGALALLKGLAPEKSPNLQLKILDLQNVWAEKDILPELEKLKKKRAWINVILGGILSNYKLQGPDHRTIFLRRANFEAMAPKNKKQKKNFGHFVLSLTDEALTKATFIESVNRFKLKLSESLVNEIINAFTITTSLIDQTAIKECYLKLYPDTRLPTPKPEKKKKKAVGRNIGKSNRKGD